MLLRTHGSGIFVVTTLATALLAAGCGDPGGPEGSAAAPAASSAAPAVEPAAREETMPAEPPAAPKSPPSYAFDPPVLDFGILRPRQAVEGTFRLRNTGDGPLKIRAMKATCACTELEPLERRELAPGQDVEVRLTLEGRASGGTRQTAINFVLEAAGGDAAQAQYSLKAEYARAVRSIPGYVSLRDSLSGIITVEALDERPFRVLSVLGQAPVFVEYDPADEPRTSYTVRYDLTEYDEQTCQNANGELMPAIVAIETDHPDAPLLDLIARHRCTVPGMPRGRSWYIVQPNVNLGAVLPGEPLEIEVEIKWLPKQTNRSATIVLATSEAPDMLEARLLEAVPTANGFICRLEVTPRTDVRGLAYARIRLQSQQHEQPMVVVASVRDDIVDQTDAGR